jgi:hypothetical protein
MKPEKPCGILRVFSRLYAELGKPITAEEWHTALLLPDDYEISKIEPIAEYFELHILTWDIPLNGDGRIQSVHLSPICTQDSEQGTITCTGMGISYTIAIPVQAQKQRKREATIHTKG